VKPKNAYIATLLAFTIVHLAKQLYINNDEFQDPRARAQGGNDSATKHSHKVVKRSLARPEQSFKFRATIYADKLRPEIF
jgi:hypothetical protein